MLRASLRLLRRPNRATTAAVGRGFCTGKASSSQPNVDPEEIAKFAEQAETWWHPNGSAAPLHRLNPQRVAYIRSTIESHVTSVNRAEFLREQGSGVGAHAARFPLSGYEVLDVGCGAGLVTEPLTRLGATVLGIDMSEKSIAAAKQHMQFDYSLSSSNRLSYQVTSTDRLVADTAKKQYDAVLALEIIEHVPDHLEFIRHLAALTKPGGVLVLSTINRTLWSYASAIVAAEYILRWLPPQTHNWSHFVTPAEVSQLLEQHTSFHVVDVSGITYNPITGRFALSDDDTSVNYLLTAVNAPDSSKEQAESSASFSDRQDN